MTALAAYELKRDIYGPTTALMWTASDTRPFRSACLLSVLSEQQSRRPVTREYFLTMHPPLTRWRHWLVPTLQRGSQRAMSQLFTR